MIKYFISVFVIINCACQKKVVYKNSPNVQTTNSDANSTSSTGTRGGGDANVIEFMMIADLLVQYLQTNSQIENLDFKILDEVVMSLKVGVNSKEEASIVFQEQRPKDQFGISKIAIYDTVQKRIFVHRTSWLHLEQWEKLSLVLLEILGLSNFENRYEEVNKLVRKNYTEILKSSPSILNWDESQAYAISRSKSELFVRFFTTFTINAVTHKSDYLNLDLELILKLFKEDLAKSLLRLANREDNISVQQLAKSYLTGYEIYDLNLPLTSEKYHIEEYVYFSEILNLAYIKSFDSLKKLIISLSHTELLEKIVKIENVFLDLKNSNTICKEMLEYKRENLRFAMYKNKCTIPFTNLSSNTYTSKIMESITNAFMSSSERNEDLKHGIGKCLDLSRETFRFYLEIANEVNSSAELPKELLTYALILKELSDALHNMILHDIQKFNKIEDANKQCFK